MHFYRLSIDTDAPTEYVTRYFATQKEAHDAGRDLSFNRWLFVDLVDIPTDKANLVEVLNGQGGFNRVETTLRTWKFTPRGGLKESTVDADADTAD